MEVIENKHNKLVLAAIGLLFLFCALCIVLNGCMAQSYTYKVTFQGGDYEYYELNYKPKQGSKSIEYEGQTILGVQELERVK